MVELRRCVVSVGMVVGRRGAPWCRQPTGRCSRLDFCTPGWSGSGRLACGLFIFGSFSLQLFGWYMVVLATLRSVCSSWGLWRCSPRRCSRMLSLLSSRLVLRLVAAGLSDVAVIVLQPGRARRVVLVRGRRSCQWLACLGLCGGPYGPWRAAFGHCRPSPTLLASRRVCFVLARPFLARPCVRLLCCCLHYAWLVLLVGRRLRRLMVGLSCCWMCWAVVAVSGRFRLFRFCWAGTASSGGASPPS